MDILIVTQYFWPEEFRINDLARELSERGHRVSVLTGKPNYPGGHVYPGYRALGCNEEPWDQIEIHRVPMVPRGRGGAVRLVLNYLSFALSASVLGPRRLQRRYDAIFVFEPSPVTVGLPAVAMKRATGAPILFWVLDLWPESVAATGAIHWPPALSALDALTRWIYRRCDLVLAQSRGFLASLTEKGVDTARQRYFPSWAEGLYVPRPRAAVPPALQPLPEGFRVMFAGNLGAAQDFPSILTAAELLRDQPIHWLIVGDGRMAEWVRDQVRVRGLGERVHLYGRHPVASMPEFFAQADALLVSLRREPIFALTIPAKIQSYLACGRPIVAMLDGEGRRIVEEAGAGVTCGAEDARGLADAVRQLAALTPEEREHMGAEGLAYTRQHFSREALISQLEAWMYALAPQASAVKR